MALNISSVVVLTRQVRLLVAAGAAKPGPAIGQALGPLGLNMANFCKEFNDKTKHYEKDLILPVILSAFSNRTFTFQVKTPPTTWFILKCAGLEKGSTRAGHLLVGKIHVKQIYEIAQIKLRDEHMKHIRLPQMARMVAGSAKSLGILVCTDDTPASLIATIGKDDGVRGPNE